MTKLIPSFSALGKRIGIFGGSFDPVHSGHVSLAKLAQDHLKLNCVVFIPTNQNPLKTNAPVASNQNRIEMLCLALTDQKEMYVSDIECRDNLEVSYSVDTLKNIQSDCAGVEKELFFLIGADQLEKLHLWKKYQELFELANVMVFGRAGFSVSDFTKINPAMTQDQRKKLEEGYIEFNFPISSSEIRDLLKNGKLQKVRPNLPKNVFELILDRGLYS